MPLTLALVTTDYPPDPLASGVGVYTYAVAEGLAERGHTIHVVSRIHGGTDPTVSTTTHDRGGGRIVVHRLGPARMAIPRRMRTRTIVRMLVEGLPTEIRFRRRLATFVRDLVARTGVQLIEAADVGAEMVLFDPRHQPHVPFVVRLHGSTFVIDGFDRNVPWPLRQAMRLVERRLMNRANHLTCPSEAAADLNRTQFGLLDRPITVFPNPPNPMVTARVAPSEGRPVVPQDSRLVLFVGRLTRSKGVEVLARAFPSVLDSVPDARLVMVGPDYPTPEPFPSTQAFLEQLLPPAARRSVTFAGLCTAEETIGYYRRAAVCVFPSLFDTVPYTCLEAMTLGKAIVGSRNSGMRELLADGAGLLYTPPDADELADHIVALLRDPAARDELGRRASMRATGAFGREAVMDSTEAFYLRVLTETRGATAGT